MEKETLIKFICFLIGVVLFLGYGAFYWWRKLKKAEKRKEDLESKFEILENKVNTMQLESIDYRLNPHLFKNILNSIQSHAYQTFFALDKLANVLDYILYESHSRMVTPKEEIAFALNLIEINKIKISPLFELKVKTKVNENEPLYHQKLLAPLISVDLIENAFKHADLQSSDAFIAISFEFKNDTFYQTVSNKISATSPIKKERSGIGTEALEQRLKIIYKNHFKLEKFREGDVFISHLTINLFDYKAEMLATR